MANDNEEKEERILISDTKEWVIFTPEYSMITPITRNYKDWDLEPETLAKSEAARETVGVSRVDTWNFDGFICTAIVNGILNLDITNHHMRNTAEYRNYCERNPDVVGETFNKALTFIARTLSEYLQDHDAFIQYRGKDELNKALKSFLALYPCLNDNSHGAEFLAEPDVSESILKRHKTSRKEKVISWYDVSDLDVYLAKIFSTGFNILADEAHSHPHDLPYEEWQEQLRTLANAFKEYSESAIPLSPEMKEFFIKRFPNFWD